MSPGSIRLLVVDDETVLRQALAQILGAEEDIQVVGQAANGESALALSVELAPDVILMDLNMPKLDGIAAAQRICATEPHPAVVILTVYHDDENVFRAIKAGAVGYVLKDAPPEQALEAIRAAARGEGFLHPSLVSRVMGEFARVTRLRESMRETFAELTRREMEVLEALGKGMRNREIADWLGVSEKTVKNHVTAVLSKLQVNDRTSAALLAAKHGLTE